MGSEAHCVSLSCRLTAVLFSLVVAKIIPQQLLDPVYVDGVFFFFFSLIIFSLTQPLSISIHSSRLLLSVDISDLTYLPPEGSLRLFALGCLYG